MRRPWRAATASTASATRCCWCRAARWRLPGTSVPLHLAPAVYYRAPAPSRAGAGRADAEGLREEGEVVVLVERHRGGACGHRQIVVEDPLIEASGERHRARGIRPSSTADRKRDG